MDENIVRKECSMKLKDADLILMDVKNDFLKSKYNDALVKIEKVRFYLDRAELDIKALLPFEFLKDNKKGE